MAEFGKQMSRNGRRVAAALLLSTSVVAAAAANPTAPSLKPVPQIASSWMEQGEFTLLTRALEAADDGRWSEVRSALGRLADPGAQALLRWRLATDGSSGMGYADLAKAMEEFTGWPDLDKIEEQAERTIGFSSLTSDERIAWPKSKGPQTSDGVLELADAYHSLGKPDEMFATIRREP